MIWQTWVCVITFIYIACWVRFGLPHQSTNGLPPYQQPSHWDSMDMQLFHCSRGFKCENNGRKHAFDTCTHALNNFISLNRNLMKIKWVWIANLSLHYHHFQEWGVGTNIHTPIVELQLLHQWTGFVSCDNHQIIIEITTKFEITWN
jgi:hypothetical protein